MSTDNPYRPISCDQHSFYELAIMHHDRMVLRWSDGNVVHNEAVEPKDLVTENGEEFLILRRSGGETVRVRLDHIRPVASAVPVSR
jgi:transcriptional antiterminator Rof (Rho-off)